MMKQRIAIVTMLGAMCLAAGCELESERVPSHGSVRLENQSTGIVHLYLNDELRLTLEPGKEGRRAVEDDALQRISIRDDAGRELFGQIVEIPRNTFAAYTVLEGGQVVATAGNIRRPDVVGGDAEQIRVENRMSSPVRVFLNGQSAATIPPFQASTLNIADVTLTISIRRSNGGVLFEQTATLPENTVIHYTVLADGTVVTTGGPIEENIDINRPGTLDDISVGSRGGT
jgi:hypothetical protein